MRRTLILAALLASGATVLAQQRATFILNSGDRVSGVVNSGTASRGFFNRSPSFLVDVNNRQVQVPMSDVAVIEFDTTRPSPRELAALPYDGSHLVVFRDGTTRDGRLTSISGNVVRWTYEPGDTEQIPIRDIRRIYLNADGARNAYDYNNRSQSQYGRDAYARDPYARDPYGSNVASSRAIRVPANTAWTDTGIDVRAGEALTFLTEGEVSYGQGGGMSAQADGNAGMKSDRYPVRGMAVGALIGRVGRSAPFYIGGGPEPIRAPASGRLMLGVNDDERGDNSGAFSVTVRRER